MERYGQIWPKDCDDLEIEMEMIRRGGRWTENGRTYGRGRAFHYERMRNLLWPELDDHRWHRLCRDEILRDNAKITVLMGAGSSAKTHAASWIYLCEYFCWPEETCVLVASTDIRGLRKRVWAEITMLWQRAKDQYDYLPGNLLDGSIAICTDALDDSGVENRRVRDMRKGIFGVPCINSSNSFTGLSKYHGIKQKRMRVVGDELSMMNISILKSFANLNQNPDFQAVLCFNPRDILDPGGQVAEPLDGWGTHLSPDKTAVWDTKFMRGRCVNLIGTDSPNFDDPEKPNKYPYLIGPKKIAEVLTMFDRNSPEFLEQCVGSMQVSVMARRVITRDLCLRNKAAEQVVWADTNRTRLGALDAAYGGDRCVLIKGEFGKDVAGKFVLQIASPVTVPIVVKTKEPMEAEDQIAVYVRDWCKNENIPAENFFHDSTGRGSLGTALARHWSAACSPVEFGGAPSTRVVSLDHFVLDPKTRQRRLKLCTEHYSKFVTELWYSVRYLLEAGQLKGLADDVRDEGCMREWRRVGDDRIELESKSDMKARTGRSPDLFDALAILVEGARRRGLAISKLANESAERENSQWLEDLQRRQSGLTRRQTLVYS